MEVSRALGDRLKEFLSDPSDSIPVGSRSYTVVLGEHGREGRDAVLVDAHVVDDRRSPVLSIPPPCHQARSE
eukprot:4811562-Prymnesium_polylepis.1